MKITIVNGTVTAVSQTKKEAHALINLALVSGNVAEKREGTHKKHQFKKTCEWCNKSFKGAIGLGIHKNKCPKKVVGEAHKKFVASLTQPTYGGVHV